MSGTGRRPVVALVTHARHVPALERGRFASTLRQQLGASSVIVETCHRVEAYTTRGDHEALAATIAAVPSGGRVMDGSAASRHLVSVAMGHDSIVLGEDQILHQIRTSLESARTSGSLAPEVERLVALALQAGRRARSWRSGRPRSLADLAIEAAEGLGGPIRGRETLMIGAGEMGALMARAAHARGAVITVANRSTDRARRLVSATGGRSSALDPGADVGRFAAIFVAIGGPWVIADPTRAAILGRQPVVVDLSVPSALPAALATGLGDRVVSADDLAVRAEGTATLTPDPRSDRLIDQTVQAFADWLARGDARSAADALVRHADLEREAELAALWKQLPSLQPEDRAVIERMTRHLAARLLRQPLQRLGRDADGVDGRAVRDLFAL
jgi:glutamyl-tRNA reductase